MTVVDWCRRQAAITAILLTTSMLLAISDQASAQDFYKNKQIRMIIGHSAGNDYDLAGRFLAR
ncbi:MAG: hypothetical protein QOI40_3923, partial [Alphaproteobacteria bacterium]|nr:hypothetical protein [Alphaproteobacteria bacterium]